ncbi:AAA family ATPase, partial [Porphyromonas cangingivalis]|uniref:AAA family ATPase n=1 Tax=Porphyromonas cangingivalis TaxID=36874 RepID=UPI000471212A
MIGKDVTTDDEWKNFIEEIRKDTSHITNKLHQTINYLLGGHNSRIYKDIGGRSNKSVTIDDFSSITVSDEYKNKDKIYRIPPPIFSLEILVKKSREEGEKDREHSVSQLSSGEKQLLYTISCILYHIRNINSVADTHATLVKYKNINIILDEIELYFHPEYQREFLFRLIKAIRTMGYQEVHSINILLATHSPFILSDIPQSKVLYLEEGVPSSGLKQETFGANIHSMLKDSFFIENMPIGEFAQKKIERLLTDINEKKKDYDELQREINLVGEPIIRRELTNLLNESYSIDLQIKQKEKEL